MRRRVVVILVFLLAGALVNVGVAWIVAAAIEPDRALMTAEPSRGLTAADHPRWKVTVGTALGSTLVGSSATREPPPRQTETTPPRILRGSTAP